MEIEAFINRVAKSHKHLSKWAKREKLDAYRIYDRDMPEFPFAVDRYGDHLHVQQFERKREFSDELLPTIVDGLAERLQLEPNAIALKTRKRQRGLEQYEKEAQNYDSFLVQERDLLFEVNMQRYLDTGLFLDHRNTRELVRNKVAGKHFLNLFAYTGSFTVYAASGGAASTLTTDLSNTYQEWSKRNLAHNKLDDAQKHQFIQGDTLVVLQQLAAKKQLFDIIVLDPPSFSNSSRMHNTFDVQRDQISLLRDTLSLLSPGGELYFSNNRKGFKLDDAIHSMATVEDISHKSVPQDFKRHQPHQCWILHKD